MTRGALAEEWAAAGLRGPFLIGLVRGKMKVITMYLPQFHRVKENDEWWGEGFTEWTAVRDAERLFPGHEQPRVPLNGNYYDLMDKETMRWQAGLMKEYGVDVQCFYHYYFKDGRKILEKPAENLLRWKDIDMPFCFDWANETWARTWSGISLKNPWSDIREKTSDKSGNGILLEQQYGGEEDWRLHFEYLLPFFRDERYWKKDNRPVFLIHRAESVPCLREMVEKWNQWARESGFDGIYWIGANSGKDILDVLNLNLQHEPQYSQVKAKCQGSHEGSRVQVRQYDDVWKMLLNSWDTTGKTIFGGFTGYDDTPRQGLRGRLIDNHSPEKFQYYLTQLIAKNVANGNDLIFINAWNEWGEGMYLEPDEKHGYAYLEAVRYAREHYEEYLDEFTKELPARAGELRNEIEAWADQSRRYASYWQLLDSWLWLKEEQIPLEKFFLDRGARSVAVYGAGMLGRHLLKELEDSQVQVEYVIDQKAEGIDAGLKAYRPDDSYPPAEMIVVTATYDYHKIRGKLAEQGHKNIVSLDEVVLELLGRA